MFQLYINHKKTNTLDSWFTQYLVLYKQCQNSNIAMYNVLLKCDMYPYHICTSHDYYLYAFTYVISKYIFENMHKKY